MEPFGGATLADLKKHLPCLEGVSGVFYKSVDTGDNRDWKLIHEEA